MANVPIERPIFHDNVTTPAMSKEWNVYTRTTMLDIEISGDATAFEILVEKKTNDIWQPCLLVKMPDAKVIKGEPITETIGKGTYLCDLTAMDKIRINIISISGGYLTITGLAVD